MTKSLVLLCLFLLVAVSLGRHMDEGTKPPEEVKVPPAIGQKADDAFSGKIRTQCLEIVNKKGNVVASLQTLEDGAGLWLTSADGPMIAIYTTKKNTAAIGMYTSSKGDMVMPLALTLGPEGKPSIQVYDPSDKELKTLGWIDLLKAAKMVKDN